MIAAKIVILAATIVFSFKAYTGWGVEHRKMCQNYTPIYENSFADSLTVVCRALKYGPIQESGKRKSLLYQNQKYLKEKLNFKLVYNKKNFKKEVSPLIIIIPGVFNNTNSRESYMWQKYFVNLGYHVLILPNSLSTQFIKARPKYALGDFEKTGKLYYELSNEVISILKRKKLFNHKISLFGLSHGAFLTSVLHYNFVKNSKKIHSTTLISPPVNLRVSFNKLDNYISRSLKNYKHYPVLNVLKNIFSLCQKKAITQDDEALAEYAVSIYGFQKSLFKSVKLYNDIYNKDIIHRENKKEWKKYINFEETIKAFSPKMLSKIHSKKVELNYWINKSKSYGKQDIRILMSQNDFINSSEKLTGDEVIYLKGGGHTGFIDTHWFKNFINFLFQTQ